MPSLSLTVGCEDSGKGRKLTFSLREKVLHPSKFVWLQRTISCRDCNYLIFELAAFTEAAIVAPPPICVPLGP